MDDFNMGLIIAGTVTQYLSGLPGFGQRKMYYARLILQKCYIRTPVLQHRAVRYMKFRPKRQNRAEIRPVKKSKRSRGLQRLISKHTNTI